MPFPVLATPLTHKSIPDSMSFLYSAPSHAYTPFSFLGTGMRVYSGNVETFLVEPPPTHRPSQIHVLPPTFLEGEWALDVLSQGGFERMKAIVRDIRTMADRVE